MGYTWVYHFIRLSRVADALDFLKAAARQGGCSLLPGVELTPAASEAYIETLFELEQICCDQSHRIGAAVFMLDIMKTYAWSSPSLAFDFMDPTRDPQRRSHRIACLDQLMGVGCLDEHGLTPYL